MKKVEKGSRVYWRANPKRTGTIKEFFLTENPFYVLWDNGNDDWYKGSDLRLIEETNEKNEDRKCQRRISIEQTDDSTTIRIS